MADETTFSDLTIGKKFKLIHTQVVYQKLSESEIKPIQTANGTAIVTNETSQLLLQNPNMKIEEVI